MLYSPVGVGDLHVVEVRFGAGYREQVADSEFPAYADAHGFAARLVRWLHAGKFAGLPESALDLRGELRAQGFDPKDADVWVVELPRVSGGYDTRGRDKALVLVQEPDGDEDVIDTVVLVEAQVRR